MADEIEDQALYEFTVMPAAFQLGVGHHEDHLKEEGVLPDVPEMGLHQLANDECQPFGRWGRVLECLEALDHATDMAVAYRIHKDRLRLKMLEYIGRRHCKFMRDFGNRGLGHAAPKKQRLGRAQDVLARRSEDRP